MFSKTSLALVCKTWSIPEPPAHLEKSPWGLYGLLVEHCHLFGRDAVHIEGIKKDSASPVDFVRSFVGDLPQIPFNCGIWMPSPGVFQAICPYKEPEVTGTLLISAFQLGICSPLVQEYPGYLRAQQGLIDFFYEISRGHGALATHVWDRMNAASPFRDPDAEMKKYTAAYFEDRDWA